MVGKTHRMGGIAFGVLASTAFVAMGGAMPLVGACVLTSGSAIGSISPDIDKKGSMIGKKFPRIASIVESTLTHRGALHSLLGLFVFTLITVILSNLVVNYSEDLRVLVFALSSAVAVMSVNYAVKGLFHLGHRRLTKKAKYQMDVAIIILCLVLSIAKVEILCSFFVYYVTGLVIGYFSHLVLDSFNPTGIKWLYPMKKSISLANIKTGSNAEGYVFKLCLAITLISTVVYFII